MSVQIWFNPINQTKKSQTYKATSKYYNHAPDKNMDYGKVVKLKTLLTGSISRGLGKVKVQVGLLDMLYSLYIRDFTL